MSESKSKPNKILNDDFEQLCHVIARLRGPGGCPWDQQQTHESLSSYAIEEVFEMVEAIENHDDPHLCEELGDVLFQVVLHSAMAEERNKFSINDVIEGTREKVIRRHPHVFSDTQVAGTDEVLKNWEEIKRQEKATKSIKKPIDVPVALPALQRSFKIGEKTRRLKFDWTETKEVLIQLKDEIRELEEVIAESESVDDSINSSHESQLVRLQHEIGDVLFSAAQVARHLNVEPESALRSANQRFLRRFEEMLLIGKLSAEEFAETSQNFKEELWKKAKASTSAKVT